MRMIVFFDLPTLTDAHHREYARFRRFLIQSGFMMMQESVYCKLALNGSAVAAMTQQIRKNKPREGLIQLLTVTEKQFGRMENILGENTSEIIDSDERLVIL